MFQIDYSFSDRGRGGRQVSRSSCLDLVSSVDELLQICFRHVIEFGARNSGVGASIYLKIGLVWGARHSQPPSVYRLCDLCSRPEFSRINLLLPHQKVFPSLHSKERSLEGLQSCLPEDEGGLVLIQKQPDCLTRPFLFAENQSRKTEAAEPQQQTFFQRKVCVSTPNSPHLTPEKFSDNSSRRQLETPCLVGATQ